MIIYPDSPFRNIHPSQHQRHMNQVVRDLRDQGMELSEINDSALRLNLRGLFRANGTVQLALAALFSALEALSVARCDYEAADPGYLLGNTVDTHAVSRGIESRVPAIVELLTSLEPSEVITNLHRAIDFVYSDILPNPDAQAALKDGASFDLAFHGLIESRGDYRAALDRNPEEEAHAEILRKTPNYSPTDAAPWRSPFDGGY